MGIRFGRKLQVELSDDIARMVRHVLDRVAPKVVERVEDQIRDIESEALARWPVGREQGRPHSRDTFTRGVDLPDMDTVRGYIGNSAAYLYYIKSYRNGLNGKSASVELIRKPMRDAAEELAKLMAEDVAKLIKG